jgi:1-acyl-sn-glycerol-3-phosphate acyltransferase
MTFGNLDYYWRLAATGACFAAFGVGGVLLSTLVFPTLRLLPERNRSLHARWLVHKSFGLFMQLMQAVGVMRFDVVGADRLRNCRHTLVLANHPTLIDIVALVSLMPAATCVVKRTLWKNPFFGGVVRAAGYISNSEPEKLIEDCAEELSAGNALIIFPEGTRSEPGKALHFQRGAAYIALESGMPILPVLIHCDPATLAKNEKWYQIPQRRVHLRIEVLQPVAASLWVQPGDRSPIAARKLSTALEQHFTRELKQNGRTGT